MVSAWRRTGALHLAETRMTTEKSGAKVTQQRRTLRRQITIDPQLLPPDPDLTRLPRLATREQLGAIHAKYFGPLSPRTIEALPLPYRRLPGSPALYEVAMFLAWAQRRLESAPVLMGGRARRVGPTSSGTQGVSASPSAVGEPETGDLPAPADLPAGGGRAR